MNNLGMSGSCLISKKADICKDISGDQSSRDSKEQNAIKQSTLEAAQIDPREILNKNDTCTNKDLSSMQMSSFTVFPEAYKALLDNLYIAKLWFLRDRNITMNQINVIKEEANEHMYKIKQIVGEELDNPEVCVESLAQELVKAGNNVVRNQQALNRIEMEELVKSLDSLLDTLKSDVREVNSAKPKYEEDKKQISYVGLLSGCSYWCLLALYFSILIMGISPYLS